MNISNQVVSAVLRVFLFLVVWVGAAGFANLACAVPQFAVESARSCQSCHVAPVNWENPELKLRKCSLNCNACHVNPTGAGMRHEAGRFYGLEPLPTFGARLTDSVPVPSSPPPPGSPERFAGLEPHPMIQIGADVRMMVLHDPDAGREDDVSVFPMQTDVHFAFSPHNPRDQNEGRFTVLGTVGALGSRDEEFDGFADRIYLKELMGIYHDLPYQAYVKAGRFLPAFGWRLDDHTAFTRQSQTFDHERQVTGVEVGFNPNYAYGHFSVWKNTPTGDTPIVDDSGYGTALTAGYRELLWQAGGSLMFESRDDADDVWAGTNWALNLFKADHPWKGGDVAPVVYLGEIDLRMTSPDLPNVESVTGFSAYHQVDVHVYRGIKMAGRYDWIDRNIDIRDDHQSRYTAELRFFPLRGVEVITQYRHLVVPNSENESQGLVQLHLWH